MPQESLTDYAALFDDEGDYSALFDDEPSEPMPPTDEGGAGDVGPPTQFPDKPIDPALRMPAAWRREQAKQEGLQDAIPFLRDLESAMTAGISDKTYGGAKDDSLARRDALREEFPFEYWSRNVPGAIGAGYLTSRAGIAAEALGNLGQAENYGSAGALDAALPFAVGGAISGGVRAGMKLAQVVGKALRVPLAAAEKLMEAYGPRRIAKMLSGADASEAGQLIAKRIESLKGNIDAETAFNPAEVPKIEPQTPEDWRALELADQEARGNAEILPGDSNYSGPPSLEGGEYDSALRDAMRKNVPDFDARSDLLGEFERLKYPEQAKAAELSKTLPESMNAAGEQVPTKNAVVRAEANAPSHLQPPDGHSLDPVTAPPPKQARLPPRAQLYRMLKDEVGIDDHDLSKADAYYEAWKAGKGPKPPPFLGPHLDEANQVFGRTGRRRFTSAREVFDHVLAANEGKSWEDVERTLPLMRTIPGFEKLRLPGAAEEAILAARQVAPAERSASFNPERLDAQLEADRIATERAGLAHKGEFRGPTGRAKDKPRLVRVPQGGEGSFLDDYGLQPANEADLVSGVHQRRVRLDDSALEPGVREESELSRQFADRMDRSSSGGGVQVEKMTSAQRAEMLNAVKADTKAGVQQRRAALVTKAREYRTLMAQADAIESQNRMEAARLRDAAERARSELNTIMQDAGTQADTSSAAVRGSGTFGAGIPLPMRMLRKAFGGAVDAEARDKLSMAMAASDAGRELSAWAAANAERWAAGGDELARVARWALSGTGGAHDVRMFMLGQLAQESGASE